MIKVVKNGVVVSVLLDTRTVNKEGTYPVKIKVYFQGKPKYYPTGICMSTKEELEEVLESKSKKNIEIQDIIGKELSRILKNVDILVERGTFSFSNLNNMLGKNIGGTLNEMISAKIKELENEEKFGTSAFYKGTLSLLKRYMKHDVPINEVTVEWLNGLEKFILKTANQTTVAMNMRNIRATMNIAKQVGVIRESDYPFGRGKYQIKESSGKKKALNKKQLKAIAEYNDGSMTTEFYRDLWLFIYFCNGLNVADLISLKFSDIQNKTNLVFEKMKSDNSKIENLSIALNNIAKVYTDVNEKFIPAIEQILDIISVTYKNNINTIPENLLFLLRTSTALLKELAERRIIPQNISKVQIDSVIEASNDISVSYEKLRKEFMKAA